MTNIKKYGVEFPQQDKTITAKRKKTIIDRYGVTDSRRIGLQKLLESKGLMNVSQIPEVRTKIDKTCLERYGSRSAFVMDDVKRKTRETNLRRYGKTCYTQTEEYRKKCIETNLRKYGKEYYTQTDEFKKNSDWKSAHMNRHATMKLNGTYGKSKIEDKFFVFLTENFADVRVERQKMFDDFEIDFYLPLPYDAWIQFDGVYWHGLDRPIETIKESKFPRDSVIYNTFQRDIIQEEVFRKEKLKLVRITDKEFKSAVKTNKFEIILLKIKG